MATEHLLRRATGFFVSRLRVQETERAYSEDRHGFIGVVEELEILVPDGKGKYKWHKHTIQHVFDLWYRQLDRDHEAYVACIEFQGTILNLTGKTRYDNPEKSPRRIYILHEVDNEGTHYHF